MVGGSNARATQGDFGAGFGEGEGAHAHSARVREERR